MGLRRLLQRKAPPPSPAITSQALEVVRAGSPSPEQPPLSAEQAEDLRDAWAELSEAAQQSKVLNFHACTRTGQSSWAENPAAVRAIAAILRDFPKDGQQTT
jgi:hypothetical protein